MQKTVNACVRFLAHLNPGEKGGWGTPYDGLYGEALLERGTFFRLEVYKSLRIS